MPSKFSDPNKKTDWTHPTARLPQFWSFSRWNTFQTCWLRYALAYIWKLQTPDNYALERGIDIHAKSDGYLKGTIKGLPDELAQFRQEYVAIKKLGAVAEESYTVTKTWQPTYATDWDNAWLRAKVDIEIVEPELLTIIDVKTGKAWDDHEFQAEIYGTIGFVIHPEATNIDFEYWYVDSGEVGHYEFERGDLRAKKRTWAAKVRPMLKMKTFKARPTESGCAYCPFRSDKKLKDGTEGPCQAWK